MERNNILSPLTSKIHKHEFIIFDTETIGKESNFYICGIKTEKEYITYFNKEEAIKHLLNINIKGYRVCTNLHFDFNVLFYNHTLYDKFEYTLRGSNIIIAIIKIGHATIKFIDAYNFGGFSVEQQGKITKTIKLGSPACLGRLPKDFNELCELITYNKGDCDTTQSFMKLIQDGINELGGELKITIASCALNVYRRKYLNTRIKKEKATYKKVNDYIYDSYYGGRTEVFKRGLFKNIKVYDVNSLYAFVMLNNYPNPNSVKYIRTSNKHILNKCEGVTKVRIYCPYMKRPFLPFRYNNKLIFPTGEWTGTYTNVELRFALKLGYKINQYYSGYYYTKTEYYFNEYINNIYALRLEYQKENNPLQYVAKLLLASLYGKFGQHYVTNFTPHKKEADMVYPSNFINGKDYVYEQEELLCDSVHVFPIFSSYTTAYARIYMYQFFNDDVVYTDTDSIFTLGSMKTSNALGSFKLDSELSECLIIKPKLYIKTFNDGTVKVKAKGLRGIKAEDVNDLLTGKEFNYILPSKLKTSIRKGISPNTWQNLKKHTDLNDNKRKWSGKFNPLIMEDSEPLHIAKRR